MFSSNNRTAGARTTAQAARAEASDAFVALDDAHRTLAMTVEAFANLDANAEGRRMREILAPVTQAVNAASMRWIDTIDARDKALEPDSDASARDLQDAQDAYRVARDELIAVLDQVNRFSAEHPRLADQVQQALTDLAPRAAAARQSYAAAKADHDRATGDGLTSTEVTALMDRCAALAALVEQGAPAHGVAAALNACHELTTTSGNAQRAIRNLRDLAADTATRISSTATRIDGVQSRLEQVDATLSVLRRKFSLACSEDLNHVPATAGTALGQAKDNLAKARDLVAAQNWVPAAAALRAARDQAAVADSAVNAVVARRRDLEAVAADPTQQYNAARFVVRDAQGLVVSAGANAPANEATILDNLVVRLEKVQGHLTGVHPDYWSYLVELRTITELAGDVVRRTRAALATPAKR